VRGEDERDRQIMILEASFPYKTWLKKSILKFLAMMLLTRCQIVHPSHLF